MPHQFLLHFHRSSGLVQPRTVRVAERMPTDLSELPCRDLACVMDENPLAVCRGLALARESFDMRLSYPCCTLAASISATRRTS